MGTKWLHDTQLHIGRDVCLFPVDQQFGLVYHF